MVLCNLDADSYEPPGIVFDFSLNDGGWVDVAGHAGYNAIGGYWEMAGGLLAIKKLSPIYSGITHMDVWYEVNDGPCNFYGFELFHIPDWSYNSGTPLPAVVDETTGGGPPMALQSFEPNNAGPYNDGLGVQLDPGGSGATIVRIRKIRLRTT